MITVLRSAKEKAVFIEVKRASVDLENHQEQLLEYGFRDGVELAALTNGLVWWLYLPLSKGSWEERKFFTIDFQQQDIATAARHLRDYLARESVADGTAARQAESVRAGKEKERTVRETIPKAWAELCREPDEQLLDLFGRKVEGLCGYKPDTEHLAQFLAKLSLPTPVHEPKAPALKSLSDQEALSAPVVLATDGYTYTKPEAFTFRGKRYEVSTWKDVLLGLATNLYDLHRGEFVRVLSLHGRKRAYFSKDERRMKFPREISGSGIFAETNLNAKLIADICRDLLSLFRYSPDDLSIEKAPGIVLHVGGKPGFLN